MAFRRRRRGGKRRYGKRKRFGRRRNLKRTYRIAKKALRYATQDRGIFDVGINYTACDDTFGQVYDPFTPIRGVDYNNRTGDTVTVLKSKIRGIVRYTEAPPFLEQNVAIAVVLDKAFRGGTAATWEDIFFPSTYPQVAPFAFRNFENFERFKILGYKYIHTNGYNRPTVKFGFNIRLNKKMDFDGNGGTSADKSSWAIFIYQISDSTGANDPAVSWMCRTTFLR